jgi:acyl-CoA reductase-like NAD-dependent aldehyde dehydrogenase
MMNNEPKSFLVSGKWRTSEEIADVHFPFTGEKVAEVHQAGDSHLEEAVQAAVRGFEATRKLSSHNRYQILRRIHDQFEKRSAEMTETLILEGGKTRRVALGEVARAKETIAASAEEAKRVGGEIVPIDWTQAGQKRLGFMRRMPLGPVLGIVPFNYPLNLCCHKLAPAIAAGNSTILKPASATPLSALLLAEMTLEAGYPPEALSLVLCSGSKAEKLVRDPRIAFFTFTGSSDVGWHLKSVCGRKRMALELGGNAAAIVHEDAQLDYATSQIASGGFTNAGQNCISVQRVLFHAPVYEQGLKALVDKVSKLKVGDPRDADTDVGPMISEAAAAEALRRVEEAQAQGAKVLIGGRRCRAMFEPTILTETTAQMRVNREEIFAPVITVSRYQSFDEALAIANDTDFGLQSGLFTQDINRIMRAWEEIQVGGLQVNDVSTFRVDQMPYGGVKGSGIGREGPRYAIEEMTEMKLMVVKLRE